MGSSKETMGFLVLLAAVVAALLSSAVFGYVVEFLAVITPDYWYFVCFTLLRFSKKIYSFLDVLYC